MKTQISNSRYHIKILYTTTILLLNLILFGFILAYASTDLVFADENEQIEYRDIKAMVYKTDIELERSSRRPKVVSVKKGDSVYNLLTVDTNVQDVLRRNNLDLQEGERVIASSEYMLNGSLVRVIKTETVIEEHIIEIPYDTKVIRTQKYVRGEENLVQQGVLGIKKQKVLNYYEDGVLIMTKIIEERIKQEPVNKIVEVGTSMYSLHGIERREYDCPYWYSVVDNGPYTEEEKRWLKFIMHCESGCNAESNKSTYKGLFQWHPYWWSRQFKENIFDGHAQLKNTIGKYRAGESTRKNQWPACHARYVSIHGSN
jgi:hypothetical protein